MVIRGPPQGTQAALRTIGLLKAFSDERPEMTLNELCSALDLTKTTAHRLLAALESEELVERNPLTGAYRLGSGALVLGAQALSSNDLRASARPTLESLAAKTGETATLDVVVDRQVLILDEVASGHLISASVNIGTRWPLHVTATGKALMASLPDVRQLLDLPLEKYTEATITDVGELEAELARVRARGFATAVGELEEGFVAIAAAIRGTLGRSQGAISVGGPASRINKRRRHALGIQIREAADRLSQAAGVYP